MQNNGIRVYTNCRRGNRNPHLCRLSQKRKNQKQGNSFCIYSDHHRRERNQKQSNSFCIYSDHHRGERNQNKATVSVSTQAVTEEKETKSAISISTQTVTEAEQAKPVAVAPVQKKKSKSKSVRIMTDEDVAGPSHPSRRDRARDHHPLSIPG
ncbi:hypothetical protein DUI87_07956 [Hirundo rustica rustica]|uniref:Uncharacterized protein n=1 Tax=Hirundo rustica rustica TaxID=333673 RepID=A0A3M0KR44_HIRRU|nr:hypothetical protein DUI87_07956 [Hirundo rustica rustica]